MILNLFYYVHKRLCLFGKKHTYPDLTPYWRGFRAVLPPAPRHRAGGCVRCHSTKRTVSGSERSGIAPRTYEILSPFTSKMPHPMIRSTPAFLTVSPRTSNRLVTTLPET